MIIYNLLFMLITNTLLPSLPMPPHGYAVLPMAATFIWKQPSAYELLRLNRLHNQTELKTAFRQAMKEHHPDQGGDPESFNYIRKIKPILSGADKHLYDTLDITELPNGKPDQAKLQIQNYQLLYTADCATFYLVAFVFMMGLTIHPDHRHVRKYLIALLAFILSCELYSYYNPEQQTLLDWVYPRMPLFQQFVILRDFFSAVMVIVRILDLRKPTEQKALLTTIEKAPSELQQVLDSLKRLNDMYDKKQQAHDLSEQSLLNKAKGYLSKGLFIVFVGLTVMSVVGGR